MIEHEPDPLRRIPTSHADAVRAEIGAALRAARLKRSQSLEAAAQQTRIPKRFLEALENDKLDEFPAFVYMRGFLKGYCEYLDLPFDELWKKISPPAPAAADAAAAPVAATPAATNPAPFSASKKPHAAPTHAPAHAAAPHAGPSSVVAMSLAGALALGLAALIFSERRPAETARPAETTPRALMPLPQTLESKIALRAVDDAWVRVTVDGSPVFEGRLPRGGAMDWSPKRGFSLRTTAPAALELLVNGAPRPLGSPAADGEYRIDAQ